LARTQSAPQAKDHLLSWQRPIGPVWRNIDAFAAASLPLLCAAALSVAGSVPAHAEQAYALIGQPAPDFALHAVSGGNVRLSEHRGEVVVVSFWSSRCTPCRAQLAALDRSLATYATAGLSMYGVGVDDDPAQALDFARSNAVGFAMLLDPAKAVARSYQVDNLPMTVLIDRNGIVRQVLRDYSQASNGLYLRQLRALLNE
jgi:peroxiredoxin